MSSRGSSSTENPSRLISSCHAWDVGADASLKKTSTSIDMPSIVARARDAWRPTHRSGHADPGRSDRTQKLLVAGGKDGAVNWLRRMVGFVRGRARHASPGELPASTARQDSWDEDLT